MAGYWCQSFMRFYGPRQNQGQYPAVLGETSILLNLHTVICLPWNYPG